MSISYGEIEFALAQHFGWRANIVVPNVFWGLGFRHELDLMVLRPSGWATEIEIKTSLSDLKADAKKGHLHRSKRIKELYFAFPYPEDLDKWCQHVQENAGILLIKKDRYSGSPVVVVHRSAVKNTGARKINPEEKMKLLELAHMRIWSLKHTIMNTKEWGIESNEC